MSAAPKQPGPATPAPAAPAAPATPATPAAPTAAARALQFSRACARLVDAADLLAACEGIATADGTPPDVSPAPIDRHLAHYLLGHPIDNTSAVALVPSDWTVGQVIEYAADQARQAAQEAVEQIAVARGWPT